MRQHVAVLSLALVSCFGRDPAPSHPQLGPTGGYAPDDFDFDGACAFGWQWGSTDEDAQKHVSFPEGVPRACYVPVRYRPGTEEIEGTGTPGPGCGYPEPDSKETLLERARVYERIAAEDAPKHGEKVPLELACDLPNEVRRATAAANARTLRSFAEQSSERRYPYAVAGTFGFGEGAQNGSKLLPWRPSADCIDLDAGQRRLLSVNNRRAARIAEAYRAGVAPIVSVSGGAVHGKLIEAFMLGHLARCIGGVPADRILYDPCADHTHTNVRNTGALVKSIGARTAYIVTDDSIQSAYLQDWTTFDLIGGSIDARALRDFGYLVGAWRQASEGMEAGFWYTPYRFWSEPRSGRGSFACVGDVPFGN